MKRIVNGVEVELASAEGVEVTRTNDRLLVRSGGETHSALAVQKGDEVLVSYRGKTYVVEKATRSRAAKKGGSGEMVAPMPGLIVDVMVSAGQTVSAGEKLLVLEAMKTQQAFTAPFDGEVISVSVSKGEQVNEGQKLVSVKAASE